MITYDPETYSVDALLLELEHTSTDIQSWKLQADKDDGSTVEHIVPMSCPARVAMNIIALARNSSNVQFSPIEKIDTDHLGNGQTLPTPYYDAMLTAYANADQALATYKTFISEHEPAPGNEPRDDGFDQINHLLTYFAYTLLACKHFEAADTLKVFNEDYAKFLNNIATYPESDFKQMKDAEEIGADIQLAELALSQALDNRTRNTKSAVSNA